MYTNILNVQLAFPVTDPLFLCSVCWSLFGAFSLSYLSFVCFTLVIILGTPNRYKNPVWNIIRGFKKSNITPWNTWIISSFFVLLQWNLHNFFCLQNYFDCCVFNDMCRSKQCEDNNNPWLSDVQIEYYSFKIYFF
jgi:hypothetical protein